MKHLIFGLIATAAIAAPAAAQDADRFDGPFVGSQLGWQQDRRTATTSAVPPATSRVKGDGLVYGGQLGYDANLGGIVIGVEGSITGRTGSNSSAAAAICLKRLRIGQVQNFR